MEIDLYLNKKEKISKNYERIIDECIIWYPKNKEDAILQLQALGLPAAPENIISLPAGGVTIKTRLEQIKAAGRVHDKKLKYLNNDMPLEAYYYYIDNNELFYGDKYNSEIYEELNFTEETIAKHESEFKQIKCNYWEKMNKEGF